MRALDFLNIEGLTLTNYECFEALYEPVEGSGSIEIPQPLLIQFPSSIPEQPGEELDPSLTSLWNAQNDVIVEQNERLDIIYEDLEAKREKLENYNIDYGEIVLETLLEEGIEAILKLLRIPKWIKDRVEKLKEIQKAGGPLSILVTFLIDSAINLTPKTIRYIIKLYRRARSAIGAIKAENNGLLALPKSWDNYHLRLSVLMHHEEAIENLLKEIIEHENILTQTSNDWSDLTAILEKIETTLSGRAEEDEEEDLEEFWTVVEEKLTSILPVEEEENVEVENQQLPALPGKYPASIMTRFFHAILRMEAYKLQVLQKLSSNIELLQFNGQRLHLPNGDIVELTGIGTVTASPDQY